MQMKKDRTFARVLIVFLSCLALIAAKPAIQNLRLYQIYGPHSGYTVYENGSTLTEAAISGELTGSMPSPTIVRTISPTMTGQWKMDFTPSSGAANLWAVWLPRTPQSSSDGGLFEIGTNFSGSGAGHYVGNSGGQFIAVNAPSGWSGDFANFENQGVTEISFGIGGGIYCQGLTINGFGTGIGHFNSSGALSSSALLAAEIPNPAGDVIGTYAATVVQKIQGVLVDTTTPTNGQVLQYQSGSSKYVPTTLSFGNGTVTDFSAGDLSPLFTTTEATTTTTPVLSFSLTNAAQNAIFAGPSSGGTGAPLYRGMVPLDIAASAAAGKLPYASSSTVLAWSAAGADTNTIRYVGTVPTPDSYLQNTGAQVSVGAAPLEANTEFTVLGAGGSSAPQVARFIDNVSGSNPVTIQVNNTTNGKGAEIGVIGATDNFFTGTAQGDAIVRQTGGSGSMWFGSAATAFMKMSSTLIAPQVAIAPKVVTVTASSNTYTINASLGNQFRCTLAATNTIAAPTNPTDGERILVELIQDGTGSRTVTWNAAFVFGTDVASPTLSTGANKKDYVGFVYNTNSAKWHALAVARGY
jgi:hypothetical protein